MIFEHKPIMPEECIEGLAIKEDGIYVDATLGGGGHSSLIAARLSEKGTLIGIDRDTEAIEAAKKTLAPFRCNKKFVHSNYSELKNILDGQKADGILADLGVSSYQFDNPERGFSYRFDSPLDMRMDQSQEFSAQNVVNEYSADELIRILREYGEEKFARSIALNIVKKRESKKIETTFELVDIINSSMPAKLAFKGPHKARKTFQAIRIEVNRELELLKQSVEGFFDSLKPGGRLAVITFHSLEDRIVKSFYKDMAAGCICPKEFPVCMCSNEPKGIIITKKPLTACEDEINENSRSTCAKLRIIEKI